MAKRRPSSTTTATPVVPSATLTPSSTLLPRG